MKHLYCLTMFLLAVVIAGIAAGQEKKAEIQVNDQKSSIARLATLDTGARMGLLSQATKDRSELQAGLISQLARGNPKEVTFSIAYLLGRQRMEEAPRHLSPFITLEQEDTFNDRLPLWGRYPIVEALIAIGGPAIPEMIRNIETNSDPKVRELSTSVIRSIDGHEIAKFRLRRVMEQQPDSAKKARLKQAMESIKD